MREILFRGKRADNGGWIEGSLAYSDNIEPAIYFEFGKGTVKTFDFVYVKPETVGQFTGLTDKNGTMIFEGDILSDGENIFVVDWDEKFASFVLIMEGWMFKHFFVEAIDAKDAEIIGNIHDNPAKDEIQP